VPATVSIQGGAQVPSIADAIAEETERGYRGWVIHKPDLRTDELLELTRLQTWTIKRATFVADGGDELPHAPLRAEVRDTLGTPDSR
jgi:hypothetical protein